MKKIFRFIVFPAVVFLWGEIGNPAVAQLTWQRKYAGTICSEGRSVQQTSDGGYIIVGGFSLNRWKVYLIKTNASGDTLWSRYYQRYEDNEGFSVQQTSDGGYIITGRTGWLGRNESHYYAYLVKTNLYGDTLWTKTYGRGGYDEGYSVQQTTDGGYIIAGNNNSDAYLIKTDASGDTLWTRTYGGTGYDKGFSVQQTSDGGYIVAGYTDSYLIGIYDIYLIKTNSTGDALWTKIFGGPGNDYCYSVQQTSDGGYVLAGYTTPFGNGKQVYLIKTDASGDTLWTRTYGGTGNEEGYSVQQTTDGGYIIAGSTSSGGAGCSDVYLVKTNASGDPLWTRTYGGTGPDNGYFVRQTWDGGYIIAGSLGRGPDSVYVDVYAIKTDANGNVRGGWGGRGSLKAVPNPFVSYTSVPGCLWERFKVYDIMGRMVGTYQGDRIGEGLGSGVYFLKEESGTGAMVRVVKLR
jgi:hypothetical protein